MTALYFTINAIILLSYAVLLYNITGKNRNAGKLLWAFGTIAFLGFVFHMVLFCIVTRNGFADFNDVISRVLFSIQYSLEMFIANTIMFKGEVMDALKDNTSLLSFSYQRPPDTHRHTYFSNSFTSVPCSRNKRFVFVKHADLKI